jgi:hypothetical protein
VRRLARVRHDQGVGQDSNFQNHFGLTSQQIREIREKARSHLRFTLFAPPQVWDTWSQGVSTTPQGQGAVDFINGNVESPDLKSAFALFDTWIKVRGGLVSQQMI